LDNIHPYIANYDVQLTCREEKGIVEDLIWERNADTENKRESGVYFLRTSLKNRGEETM
jgi:hypothetical protein